MRRSARDIVQPVVAEGVIVFETNEEQSPVVFTIAASRPVGVAIEFVVGDGYMAGFAPATDDVLAADEGELVVHSLVGMLKDWACGADLVMIDPYVIRCLSLVTGISKRSENINDRIYPLFQTGRCLSFCSFTTRSSFGKTQGCARE